MTASYDIQEVVPGGLSPIDPESSTGGSGGHVQEREDVDDEPELLMRQEGEGGDEEQARDDQD